MPAGSGVWTAPIGTSPSDDAAWTELPVTRVGYFDPDGYGVPQRWVVGADPTRDAFKFKQADIRPYLGVIDQAVANMKRAADGYSIKQGTWSTGIDPAKWDAAIINEHSINKRSKPMALTKEHVYKDDLNGRTLRVEKSAGNPRSVFIQSSSEGVGAGAWLDEADKVPVALNVLGYDRPDPDERRHPGDAQSFGQSVWDDGHRERLLAQAADNLRAIDLYDQRNAKRKADEAAAAKAAEIEAAKERVKVANREIAERHFLKAKGAYQSAITEAYKSVTDAESAAKLQSALSAYETARRKFEGLPN